MKVNELNSSPAQQSVVMGLLQLPFALKLFCGFLSDSTPIYGKRRKPYFLIGENIQILDYICHSINTSSDSIGWLTYVICNIILAVLGSPTIVELAVFIFLAGMGFIQADVCTDAMIVERSKKFESIATRGILQASGIFTIFITTKHLSNHSSLIYYTLVCSIHNSFFRLYRGSRLRCSAVQQGQLGLGAANLGHLPLQRLLPALCHHSVLLFPSGDYSGGAFWVRNDDLCPN